MQDRESKLWIEESMDKPEAISLGQQSVMVYARACDDDTSVNQDALAVLRLNKNHYVFAVADGAGGLPLGNRASALAVQQLAATVEETAQSNLPIQYGVMKGFEAAHHAIRDLGVGSASTLTAVEVLNRSLTVFHTGDSGVLVVSQRGRVKLQTISHSPVGYAMEAGLISEQEAMRHDDLNIVSNLLGVQDMRFDVGPSLQLGSYDTVLLGSDGLFDNLHSSEIISLIRLGPIRNGAERLAETVVERMHGSNDQRPAKKDDIGFIIYRPGRCKTNKSIGAP